jgi:hypothetical protein
MILKRLEVTAALLLAALFLSGGCVTRPPATLTQPWPTPPKEGYALLMIYADHGSARGPSVFIDDTLTFQIHGNYYSWTYVRAGKHAFRTKWVWLFSGLNMDKPINLESGKSYYLKLIEQSNNNPYYTTVRVGIAKVSETIAKEEAATCWYHKAVIPQIDTLGKPLDKNTDESIWGVGTISTNPVP